MTAFAFRRGSAASAPYFVLLHTAQPPEMAIWQAYVDAITSTLAGTSGPVHAFVATDGGGPDAPQRKALASAFARGDAMTHVFTTDVFVRGIVTAFRWIARARAAAYAPTEFASVCRASGFAPMDVLGDMVRLQVTIPSVATLAQIQEGMQRAGRRSMWPRGRNSKRP